jgi:phosphoribosyl 1,2-cyclic phosphodiesterase
MSLAFCVLASGSKGNATVITNGEKAILVDCGITARQAVLRMQARGVDPSLVQAIVITHEHSDHIAGVRVLAKRLGCKVLATKGTFSKMEGVELPEKEIFTPGRSFDEAGFCIRPFDISHDAVEPVGLTISQNGFKIGFATDLGHTTNVVRQRLAGCQALIVEANHDPNLLTASHYPEWLKQRVRSRQGHLSNQQGAELVAKVGHADLACVVQAHLSENTNQPILAEKALGAVMDKVLVNTRAIVANQKEPTDLVILK